MRALDVVIVIVAVSGVIGCSSGNRSQEIGTSGKVSQSDQDRMSERQSGKSSLSDSKSSSQSGSRSSMGSGDSGSTTTFGSGGSGATGPTGR